MKAMMNIIMQPETDAALRKVPAGTVAFASANLGLRNGEPLLFAMDAMLRYARAYRLRNESLLCTDGVLGQDWLAAVRGIRGLLNGDGAVAMEQDISTDSKDNGVVEEVFWAAIFAAGFGDEDV